MKFLTDKKTLKTCHIYRMLAKNAKKPHLSMHTPGHKIGKFDLTELSFSDNLANPNGCILEAERDIAKVLGADRSFILTDGSTSGVYAMLHAAKSLGVKNIAVPAFSHQSVFRACEILGIKCVLLGDSAVKVLPEKTEILSAIKKCDALLITSPTYYGEIAPLEEYKTALGEKLLLVDGAHGGHLHYDKTRYAGVHADIWVDGVHKSLPAFTQGAVVSAKGEKNAIALEGSVAYFRTTSPSYPIMASVEYAVKYPRNIRLETEVLDFIENYAKYVFFGGDWTKLCIAFSDPKSVYAYLEKKGVYAEFYDDTFVCFYLSPATKLAQFRKVKKLILAKKKLLLELDENVQNGVKRLPAPLKTGKNGVEYVELDESAGRVCAMDCGLFPPCTPLVLKGETIEKEKAETLKNAVGTFGLKDGKIAVYKMED